VRAGEAADEALHADDADLDAGALARPPRAVEHRDATTRLDRLHQLVAAVRVPVVVAEHGEDRHADIAAGVGEHRALLRLASRRQVARQQQDVRLTAQPHEALDRRLAVIDAAVHVAGGRHAHDVLVATRVPIGAPGRDGTRSCRLLVHHDSRTPLRRAASVGPCRVGLHARWAAA
jgi:hypothetical protein